MDACGTDVGVGVAVVLGTEEDTVDAGGLESFRPPTLLLLLLSCVDVVFALLLELDVACSVLLEEEECSLEVVVGREEDVLE